MSGGDHDPRNTGRRRLRGRIQRGAALTYLACIDLFVCKHAVAVAATALYIELRIRNRFVVLYTYTSNLFQFNVHSLLWPLQKQELL